MQLIGITVILISFVLYWFIKSDFINIGTIFVNYFKIFLHAKKEYYNFLIFPLLLSIGITFLSRDYSYLNSDISVIVGIILSMLFSGLSILTAYDFSKLSNKKIRDNFNKAMLETVSAVNFTSLLSICLLVLLVLIRIKFCYVIILNYLYIPTLYLKIVLSILVTYMFLIILINIFFILKNLYLITVYKTKFFSDDN